MIVGMLSLQAQAPRRSSDPPRFEVASIKVNTANDRVVFSQSQKGRYVVVGFTLGALIRSAYRVQEFQIIGGPDWMDSERFNVEATYAEDAAGGPSRTDLMLRTLLTDRFKLAVHNDTRERPVYALVLARQDRRFGPQLQKSADCAARKGDDACGSSVGPGLIRSRGRTMAQLAESLSQLTNTGSSLNRLIVDRTGLEGQYDVTLKFTPDNIPGGNVPGFPTVDPNGPSIFTALQEQLGIEARCAAGPRERARHRSSRAPERKLVGSS